MIGIPRILVIVDSEERDPPEPVDPLEAASLSEFADHAATALETIDATHRQVLVLRIKHGLSSVEIGEALGRSPETVRSQLARGLEKLRRLLPAGHALPALLVADLAVGGQAASATVNLAALREALVVEWSLAASVTPAGMATGAGAAATKSAVGLVALAIVGLAAWWLTPMQVGSPSSATMATVPAATRTNRSSPVSEAGASNRTSIGGRTLDPTQELPAVRDGVTVEGRCVDASGDPLAGVEVRVLLQRNPDLEQLAQVELREDLPAWRQPDPFITEADGRFAFSLVPRPAHKVHVIASARGRVSANRWTTLLTRGSKHALGDFQMPEGCLLRGRVIDLGGDPVGGLSLGLHWHGAGWPFSAETRTDGTFELESPAPPGTYTLWCHEPLREHTATLPDRLEHSVVLTVDREPVAQTIEGLVTDRNGTPLADRKIRARNEAQKWTARTSDTGRFRLLRRGDEPQDPVEVALELEFGNLPHGSPIAWGTKDLHLAFETGQVVEVLAIDGATGSPIEHFGVRLVPTNGAGVAHNDSRRLRVAGSHANGLARLESVPPGSYMLSIETRDPRYAPTPYRSVHVGNHDPAVTRIEVWPPTALLCEVRCAGAPCVGSRIEALQMTGDPAGSEPTTVSSRTLPTFGGGRHRRGVVLAEGFTDADGKARLSVPRGARFALRVTGQHAPAFRDDLVSEAPQPIRFEVRPAPTVSVQIVPWPLPERLAGLQIGPAKVTERGFSRRHHPVEHDESGRFEIGGLVAADERIDIPLKLESSGASLQDSWQFEVEEMRAADRTEAALDVRPWLPTVCALRVLVDGRAASGVAITLQPQTPRRGWLPTAKAETDSEGWVRLQFPPGEARGVVEIPRARWNHVFGPIQVHEGMDQRTLEFHLGDVRLRALSSDGTTPIEGLEIVFEEDRAMHPLKPTTANGTIDLGPMPCGPLALRIWPKPLLDPAARRALHADGVDPASRLIPLPVQEIRPGPQTVDLVIPAAAGYE